MAKADWGVKRLCQSCGAKFYDKRKDPITCPSCGSVFDPENQKVRRARNSAPKSPKAAVASKPKSMDDSDEAATDDEDLAAADLGDDIADDAEGGDDDILADTEDLEEDDKIPAVVVSREEDES